MIYIDFDWNKVNIWNEDKLLKTEKALVLRDLVSKDIIAIGDITDQEMRKPGNFLSINCTENRKIGSFEDLKIRVNQLVLDNNITDFKIVNRYNVDIKDFNTIDEIEFLKILAGSNDYYVELRNDEIVIFDNNKNSIQTIKKGRAFLQHHIQSLFYLNYNATLNTKKTWDLISQINSKQTINTVVCRSYITGVDVDITITDQQFLTNVFKIINDQVSALIDTNKSVKYDELYLESFNCVL
ncbi:hypothetical protein NX779_00105 [Mycoplasma cottewii]|uniref:Uncharacterized protein n=1 Tax=Mycoplasma cottewii TaxID=51364 RepID=A0ABY5TZL6_9MOLU|nr:hypothetical protein [Mycoplasma cottewii]UWD35051.1 hypothetical protein NX779_00105 [Mycoplasma cottewii]